MKLNKKQRQERFVRRMKIIVNSLTGFRILAAFAMIPLMLLYFETYVPFIVFTVAAITDFLDGYLAKKYNASTKLGGVMDHIGDKLLVAITMIMLIPMMPVWILIIPIALMISRELYISGLREFLGTQKIEMPVPKSRFSFGKVKAAIQMVAIAGFLLSVPIAGFFISPEIENIYVRYIPIILLIVSLICFWVATFFSVWSAAQYTKDFTNKLKEINDAK